MNFIRDGTQQNKGEISRRGEDTGVKCCSTISHGNEQSLTVERWRHPKSPASICLRQFCIR